MRRLIAAATIGGVLGTVVALLPILLALLVQGPGDAQGGLGVVFAFPVLAPLGAIAGLVRGFIYARKRPPTTRPPTEKTEN